MGGGALAVCFQHPPTGLRDGDTGQPVDEPAGEGSVPVVSYTVFPLHHGSQLTYTVPFPGLDRARVADIRLHFNTISKSVAVWYRCSICWRTTRCSSLPLVCVGVSSAPLAFTVMRAILARRGARGLVLVRPGCYLFSFLKERERGTPQCGRDQCPRLAEDNQGASS